MPARSRELLESAFGLFAAQAGVGVHIEGLGHLVGAGERRVNVMQSASWAFTSLDSSASAGSTWGSRFSADGSMMRSSINNLLGQPRSSQPCSAWPATASARNICRVCIHNLHSIAQTATVAARFAVPAHAWLRGYGHTLCRAMLTVAIIPHTTTQAYACSEYHVWPLVFSPILDNGC